ncbi:uncharacterized protein [Dermacentor albipictus]|uniref:uncharacterized protein n=1 Tax=Dermacentor albipictus TaxID=60249 RepID=UPI0038FD11FF
MGDATEETRESGHGSTGDRGSPGLVEGRQLASQVQFGESRLPRPRTVATSAGLGTKRKNTRKKAFLFCCAVCLIARFIGLLLWASSLSPGRFRSNVKSSICIQNVHRESWLGLQGFLHGYLLERRTSMLPPPTNHRNTKDQKAAAQQLQLRTSEQLPRCVK